MPPGHGTDAEPDPGARGDLNTVCTFLPYLWPRDAWDLRARVILALSCLGLAKLATVTVPVIYKEAVDLVSGPQDFLLATAVGLLLAYGIVRLAQQAFAEFRDFFFARVGQRAVRTVALQAFRHLHDLALRFHLDRQTGGVSRAIERGVKGIEFILSFMIFNIIPSLLEILMVCGILWFAFDIWYALVTFVTVGGYVAFTMVLTEWRMKFRRRMNQMESTASTRAVDSLLNFETVKYFGNEDYEAKRYDRSLRRYEEAAVKSKTTLSLVNVGQGFIVASGLTAMMAMAAFDVKSGDMTVGGFVMVNTYLMQLFLPLGFLGMVYREIKRSLADMEALFRLMREPAEITDAPDARPLRIRAGEVAFRDVRFSYGHGREVLKGVSFTVSAGRTVAIVGASGAGKSTLSRLLFRFYDVSSGSIEIDGQDIRSMTLESLRAAIGIVPQDSVLFNDTIFYNIAYGRPTAAPSDIETAARQARIHDFIMSLPNGYSTSVGERGLKISGGEKQRVAIARTILKQPAIFLFDEATSSLDSHTEKAIQASLAEVSADRTTLVIAHRLSTITDADEIIVLQDGRIAERGTHQSLLDARGLYAGMWSQQQKRSGRDAGSDARSEQRLTPASAVAGDC